MANIFRAKSLISRTGTFSHEVTAPNLVYNTGNQTISGVKTIKKLKIGPPPSVLDEAVDISYFNDSWRLTSNTTNNSEIIDSALTQGGLDFWSWRFKNVVSNPNAVLSLNDPDAYVNEYGDPPNTFKYFDISVWGTGVGQYFYLDSRSGIMRLNKRPIVNGVAVLLSGDQNLVYTTGNQTINGNKSFTSSSILTVKTISGFQGAGHDSLNLIASNYNTIAQGLHPAGSINLTAGTGEIYDWADYGSINLNAGGPQYNGHINVNGNLNINNTFGQAALSSRTIRIYKTGMQFGNPSAVAALTIDNNNISLNSPLGGTAGFGLIISGVPVTPALYVNTTTNQTISGDKTFSNTGSFNTIQITNKKLSSYSFNSTNFFFGDNYLNFTNSSSNLTGILPSGIVSGINYYAKNLNSGILLISGSGQRSIDGFSTLNLYKNESVQLVGVNSVGYTGWVTISTDGGIS